MSIWTGKTIEITKTWGDARWLELPSGKHPMFRVCPYPGINRSYYHIEFDGNNMHPYWKSAWLLDIGPAYPRRLKHRDAPGTGGLVDVDRLEGVHASRLQRCSADRPHLDRISAGQYWTVS